MYKSLWQTFFFSIALLSGNWFFHAPLLNSFSDYWCFRKHGSKVSSKGGSSDMSLVKTNSKGKLSPRHFHLQISSSQIFCWITSRKHVPSISHYRTNICVSYNTPWLYFPSNTPYQNHILGMVEASHILRFKPNYCSISPYTKTGHWSYFFPRTYETPKILSSYTDSLVPTQFSHSVQTLMQVTVFAYYHKTPYSQDSTK